MCTPSLENVRWQFCLLYVEPQLTHSSSIPSTASHVKRVGRSSRGSYLLESTLHSEVTQDNNQLGILEIRKMEELDAKFELTGYTLYFISTK